jgi:thioredoxin reductase (NADPH)
MGPELIDHMRAQAQRFGAETRYETITAVRLGDRPFELESDSGSSYTCDALIVATGATAKQIGLPSESELMGYGVSACATCDGFFFRGKEVVVVGGGDTAMEEALFLTKFATRVTVVHRRDQLRASRIMQERAFANERIAWRWNSVVEEISGRREGGVDAVRLHDLVTGERFELATQGVFVAIGHRPNTELFAGILEMDPVGYLIVKEPSTATNIAGIFAAGDVMDPSYRQAITAAGTGCRAAIDAERWLAEHAEGAMLADHELDHPSPSLATGQ